MKLSVVIPCYNEEKNIPLIFKRLSELQIDASEMEFLLVNNGSTDGSKNVFETLEPNYPYIKIVSVEVNQGYGYGILSGLKAAKGEFIGWTHADLQTDPSDILKAYKIIAEKNFNPNLYVKGQRMGRPIFDEFFTKGMSLFETILMQTSLSDINAQPNIFHRSLFKAWDNPPHDFSLDLYALYMAKKNGFEIIRFPVLFPERIHGESNWNTSLSNKLKFIKRTVEFSIDLKKRLK